MFLGRGANSPAFENHCVRARWSGGPGSTALAHVAKTGERQGWGWASGTNGVTRWDVTRTSSLPLSLLFLQPHQRCSTLWGWNQGCRWAPSLHISCWPQGRTLCPFPLIFIPKFPGQDSDWPAPGHMVTAVQAWGRTPRSGGRSKGSSSPTEKGDVPGRQNIASLSAQQNVQEPERHKITWEPAWRLTFLLRNHKHGRWDGAGKELQAQVETDNRFGMIFLQNFEL